MLQVCIFAKQITIRQMDYEKMVIKVAATERKVRENSVI